MRAWAWWFALVGAVAVARELDPAACSARFDVQRDKIIRTEESRDMGARYLSELDVGTREECLRLCCETDSCDVFVYEEKSPGSCYMFNCGPPEDFRCKFTAHSNFSSGVLALSRRLAELQDQEHHERQLASLRSPTTTTPSTTSLAPAHAPPSDPPQQPPPGRCSRYQFECKRGGECIAVYNACDGIPQCADGSDEAPELGCPAVPPPPAPPLPAPTPPPPPPSITTPPPAPVVPVKPGQAQLAESGESGMNEGMLENGAGGERWPHRLSQVQPQHRYNEPARSSHIFSHKGGLLQEADPALGQYPPFEQPWPRRTWPQAPQPVMEWGGGPGMGGGVYARPADWSEPDPRRAWPVPQRPEPDMPMYMPAKTMPELPMVYSSQQQTLRDSPKKGFDLERRPAPTQPPAPSPSATHDKPVLDNTTKKKDLARPAESNPLSARHAEGVHEHFVDEHEHDGLSEHPPSAILLLVLGVAMTAAMGGMLGCRARAARRRLRRGKAGLAHDADYLVNGMYL